MTFVWIAIGLYLAVVLVVGFRMWRTARRPLSDTDRYCASVDAELDELQARRATRPHGCDVIPFPIERRSRGGAA